MKKCLRKGHGSLRKGLPDITVQTAVSILESLDCSKALAALLLIKYEEWEQLVNLSCNPADYLDASSFSDAYLASKLLAKCDALNTGIDRRDVATQKFLEAERLCEETNRSLIALRWNPQRDPAFNSILHGAAHKIRELLGDFDPDEFIELIGFGPGVSSSVKGSRVGSYYKALGSPEVTTQALPMGLVVLNEAHPLPAALLRADGPVSLLRSSMQPVMGNRIAFVPKDAKTDRSIAVEPHVNILLQKGVGGVLRRRLRRVGINLNDQSRNQALARYGSLTGSLATIDLSMASDSLSIELVRDLLPHDWFLVLDSLRSHYGSFDGKDWFRYQKFSSMGNGFTFELESLVFWAISRTIVEASGGGTVSVYGDDIIVPSVCYEGVTTSLRKCGFVPNLQKSYSSGSFRESCGADFFLGTPVRPFFIRSKIQGLTERIKVHNRIFEYSNLRLPLFRDTRFSGVIRQLRGKSSLLGPVSLGDLNFHSFWDEAQPERARHGWEGWRVKGLIQVPQRVKMVEYYAALYSSILRLGTESPTEGFTDLRGVSRSRVVTIHVSEWEPG